LEQKIIKGIASIHEMIKGKRILLVKGNSFSALSIDAYFRDSEVISFTDFTPNPRYEQVKKGVEIFNSNSCELIVAVGGGSANDVAKCIKLFSKMNHDILYLEQEKTDTNIMLIAIPTTAGTGSESTKHAVIYYQNEKQSISHDSIIPDVTILDQNLLRNLPVYQKKCTLLDALCQAIESWWSVNSTDESREYSKKAIQLICDNWRSYILGVGNHDENEMNYDAAGMPIMEAANYSGRAINITATTAPHAMSYKLTSLYGLPHGHSVALCMAEVWKYMKEMPVNCCDNRGLDYLMSVLADIDELLDYDDFVMMTETMGIEKPISKTKCEDLQILCQSVNPERLKNNPVRLTEKVLQDMYERIVEDES